MYPSPRQAVSRLAHTLITRTLITLAACALAPLALAQPTPDTQPQPLASTPLASTPLASTPLANPAAPAATSADPFSFLGISWITWALALGVGILAFALLIVVKSVLHNRAEYLAKLRPNPVTQGLVNLVSKSNLLVLLVVSLAIAAIQLPLPGKAEHAVRIAVILALSIQAILWGQVLIEIGLKRLLATKTLPDGKPDPSLLSAMIPLKFIATLILVALVALIALDNAGVNVTAMVAGLGIGGIAIALAVQNILGDLFSAVSIVIDKPFVVGDFIIVGDKMGTVEVIGLKTTRIRALSGEQLVFANSDLLTSRIQNFKRMVERRVVLNFGVTYQTTPEQLRAIPAVVKDAVLHNALTRFDRCHFNKFADSSLNFELVYFVLDPNFNTHADIQQNVLLEIFERFANAGIDFAYPTQTVYEYKLPETTIKSPLRAPLSPSPTPRPPTPHPNDNDDNPSDGA